VRVGQVVTPQSLRRISHAGSEAPQFEFSIPSGLQGALSIAAISGRLGQFAGALAGRRFDSDLQSTVGPGQALAAEIGSVTISGLVMTPAVTRRQVVASEG